MKRIWLIVAILLPVLAVSGFGLVYANQWEDGRWQGWSSDKNVAKEEKRMADLQDVEFVPVDMATAPREIRDWVEEKKLAAGKHVMTVGEHTYILVTWGEKRTGGYTVTIDSVKQKGEKLVVSVSYQEPQGFAIQVITYPYAIVAIPATEKEIVFVEK